MATMTSTTNENLKAAFAGESQAFQKYRAFAKKAEQDKLPNIARLFRTTAEAERIHAEGHLKALEGIGSSVENLQAAIGGETYEFEEMYPPMLAQAETKAVFVELVIISIPLIHSAAWRLDPGLWISTIESVEAPGHVGQMRQ